LAQVQGLLLGVCESPASLGAVQCARFGPLRSSPAGAGVANVAMWRSSSIFVPAALFCTLLGARGDSAERATAAVNPAIARYRQLAQQYKREAHEAEESAETWAARTRALAHGSRGFIRRLTHKELAVRHAGPWAAAVWEVGKMLADPSAGHAAASATRVRAPYEAAYKEYTAAGDSYGGAARDYEHRAGDDEEQAQQLRGFADQSQLQGDSPAAAMYGQQARVLSRQAGAFRGLAKSLNVRAGRIRESLPTIRDMERSAAAAISWAENPDGAPAPQEIYAFTVAPPLAPPLAPALAPAGR